MGELEAAIAQVFRKKGKSSMPEKDFVFALSLDFRWFSPKEAQKFMELALDGGLLEMDKGLVKPAFDHLAVVIPKAFAPGPEIFQKPAKPKGIFMNLVEEISKVTSLPPKEVISQVNSLQDSTGVDVEVAALMVAKNNSVDISEYLDAVEEEIGKRYRA